MTVHNEGRRRRLLVAIARTGSTGVSKRLMVIGLLIAGLVVSGAGGSAPQVASAHALPAGQPESLSGPSTVKKVQYGFAYVVMGFRCVPSFGRRVTVRRCYYVPESRRPLVPSYGEAPWPKPPDDPDSTYGKPGSTGDQAPPPAKPPSGGSDNGTQHRSITDWWHNRTLGSESEGHPPIVARPRIFDPAYPARLKARAEALGARLRQLSSKLTDSAEEQVTCWACEVLGTAAKGEQSSAGEVAGSCLTGQVESHIQEAIGVPEWVSLTADISEIAQDARTMPAGTHPELFALIGLSCTAAP
ncbi:MAG TPA: hypothetical protein VF952_09090 [Chloroflexia bacterium]|jgi:hypothetical protein